MFNAEKIANIIKEKRVAQNLTQAELAEQLGVSFQAVSNWERANAMPDISKLEDLCNALDISVGELLGMETADKPAENKSAEKQNTQKIDLEVDAESEFGKKTQKFAEKAQKSATKFTLDILSGMEKYFNKDFLSSVSNENIGEENIEDDAAEFVEIVKSFSEECADVKPDEVHVSGKKISFATLAKIAEHVDEDYLAELIEKNQDPIDDLEGFFELIEYLPDEEIAKIINRVVPEKLPELAECMEDFDDDAIEVYVARCLEAGETKVMLENAEFLSDESQEILVDYFISTGKVDMLSEIYEYLEDHLLCKIARFLIESGADADKIEEVYYYI